MRIRSSAFVVLLSLTAVASNFSCSEESVPTPDAAADGPQHQVFAFHARAGEGRTPIFEGDGLIVRAGCESFGTDTGPYLSLTAETIKPRATARVSFRTMRAGEPERYQFEQENFDPSYGEWDLLGTESGRVHGKFTYSSSGEEGIELVFSGSGGRSDGQCALRGRTRDEPPVDRRPTGSGIENLPKWTPRPIRLGPGQGEFDTCKIKVGGYDVWIKDITCRQTREWILRLHPTYGDGPYDREGVGRLEGGWECWSRLEARYGPIHNACVRGEQLILFYFA